ncbi:MAG: outer membrane lipoprotein carrier protein LolA [bacterium]|nr:outer membrane lipoprotein carrier protein LolA [bacterium]
MKRYFRSISPAVFALLVFAPPAECRGSDLETVRQSMSAVKSISAEFIQSKNMKILSKPLISKGHFYYLAPGNLRWEYDSPVKNVLLMDRGTIRKYSWRDGRFEPDLSSRLEPIRVVMEQISGCLNGSFAENKYFAASLTGSAPEKIELLPRSDEFAKMIQRIIITLSKVPGVIQTVEILEPGNSSTLIKFDRVQLDAPLPDKIFQSVP